MTSSRSQQPTSVKAIGCILLIYALFGVWILAGILMGTAEGRDDPWVLICASALPVIAASCGWFLPKGANWARVLFFTAFIPIHLSLLASHGGPAKMLQIGALLVASLLLVARSANRFFAGRDTLFKTRQPIPCQIQREQKSRIDQRFGRYDY